MDKEERISQISRQLLSEDRPMDIYEIIRCIMASPVSSKYAEEVMKVDGKTAIDQFKGKSLDVQTMMMLGVTSKALKNVDLKCIELLLKYGGYEPPKRSQVSLELPEFVDSFEIRAAQAAASALPPAESHDNGDSDGTSED